MNTMSIRITLLVGIFTLASISTASTCLPCIDRSKVSIGVVHHGHIQDILGSDGYRIEQGAKDMGINRLDHLASQWRMFRDCPTLTPSSMRL